MKALARRAVLAALGLAAALAAPADAQNTNPTDMEPLVGQNIAEVYDFNKDGVPDDVTAFVHRDVKDPKDYRIEVFAYLSTPGQFKQHGGRLDVFVLKRGQCIDFTRKWNKATQLVDVKLSEYPCQDYPSRKLRSYYRNTGDGFVKE